MIIGVVFLISTLAIIFAAIGYYYQGISGLLVGWIMANFISFMLLLFFGNEDEVKGIK
jgi:hypothetical protein